MMDQYELLKDIGVGNFGVARLMRDKTTKELVAIKYIERGNKIDQNVQREIINHRSLRHPNIVRFKEVCLTNTHLAIVMEYAAGGELFERIHSAGRFREDEARFYFQQLISGVSYCHAMKICHRDLKLENTLLDGSPDLRLKICDFGYSKSSLFHSAPKSTVGTPAYIAPEVLKKQGHGYDGKRSLHNGKVAAVDGCSRMEQMADVWSCGVTLYVMLVGAYPFEDANDPGNIKKAIGRIMKAQYTIPSYVQISPECSHLLSLILEADPSKRITIPEIMCHQWFTKNLPRDLALGSDPIYDNDREDQPAQSLEEVMHILNEARMVHHAPHGSLPLIDINDDVDEWEEKDPIPDMIHDAEVEDEADVEAEFEMDEVEYFDVEECCEFDNSSTNMSDNESFRNREFNIDIMKYFRYLFFVVRWSGKVIWNFSKFR